jgi:GTP cyclohydrolase I
MERNSIKYGYLRREINGASLKGDKMNKERIQKLWKEILKVIGEDVNREGLKNTPKRIAKMYSEVFRGYDAKNKPKITTFKNGFDGIHCKGIVCEKGYFFSHCEHHGVPFFGEYYFGYIPDKKIIGLSKVARVVDFFSSKFQVQERLTREIVNELENAVKPKGMILVLKARHLCKEMRGVKKVNGHMITSEVTGLFLENKSNVKDEFMDLIGLK